MLILYDTPLWKDRRVVFQQRLLPNWKFNKYSVFAKIHDWVTCLNPNNIHPYLVLCCTTEISPNIGFTRTLTGDFFLLRTGKSSPGLYIKWCTRPFYCNVFIFRMLTLTGDDCLDVLSSVIDDGRPIRWSWDQTEFGHFRLLSNQIQAWGLTNVHTEY